MDRKTMRPTQAERENRVYRWYNKGKQLLREVLPSTERAKAIEGERHVHPGDNTKTIIGKP